MSVSLSIKPVRSKYSLVCLGVLFSWMGFKPTTAPATMTEQIRLTANTTISVPLKLSLSNFLAIAARLSAFDVRLCDEIVENRGKQVGKQNRQHHAFGVSRIGTRINTHITPISAPYHHLPTLVKEAETGSVAINSIPMAKPPTTKCQYQGIANIALVSEPMKLNSEDIAIIPIIT